MTSLPSHSQLQHKHQDPQQRPNHEQFSPQQQRHLLHGQLYGAESLVDLDGTSPGARDRVPQTSGLDSTPRNNGGGRRRESEPSPEWGLTKAGKRRQRLPLACQVCRRKKVPSQATCLEVTLLNAG
jgi:hypothetical protein